MHAFDLPDRVIGLPDESRGLPWATFHPNGVTGGSVIGEAIAVNSGVLNPELLTERYGPAVGKTWAKSRLRDRIDAVIAHEIAEGKAGTHEGAELLAAETDLPVSEGDQSHTSGHGRKEPMIHNITAGPVEYPGSPAPARRDGRRRDARRLEGAVRGRLRHHPVEGGHDQPRRRGVCHPAPARHRMLARRP